MKHSKLIMSPKGLGIDCYRHYDTLYIGTIQIIEPFGQLGNDGWFDRPLANLPVVFIGCYENLTPDLLELEYERITQNPYQFQYGKLTRQYWMI
jgi:hypothetical protein